MTLVSLLRIMLGVLFLLANAHATALSLKTNYAVDVFFAHQHSALGSKEHAGFNQLMGYLDRMHLEVVIVVAHADSTERDQHDLSLARAMAVQNYLLRLGIAPNRIFIDAKGATQAVALPGSPKNSRVEIELVGWAAYPKFSGFKENFAALTWQALNLRIPPFIELPGHSEASTLPAEEFIARLDDSWTQFRLYHKLLVTAVELRQDDLLERAFAARAVARARLPSALSAEQLEWLANSIDPALTAFGYGTDLSRKLLRSELRAESIPSPARLKAFTTRACERPIWVLQATSLPSLAAVATAFFESTQGFAARLSSEVWGEISVCMLRDSDSTAAIQYMLHQGADPNIQYRSGNYLLHEAILTGGGALVPALLTHGARVNAITRSGDTALHLVHKAGTRFTYLDIRPLHLDKRRALWDALTAAGADPTIRNLKGELPIPPN